MKTPPSDKTLIAVLGVAVGASLALTYSNRRSTKTKRVLHPAKIVPACLQRSLPVPVPVRTARTLHSPIPRPPAPVPQPMPEPVPPILPEVPPTPSADQRCGAVTLDALVPLAAIYVFFSITHLCHASLRLDGFDTFVVGCIVVLIAAFYAFLFRFTGRTLRLAWN